MTISLAYDSQLSRVRVTGLMPGARDTFTTASTDSWSAADTGQTWTNSGTASEYDKAAGEGTQSNTTVNSFRLSLLSLTAVDVDYSATVRTSALALGAEQIAEIIGRYIDSSNFYRARLSFAVGAGITLSIRKRVAGAETVLDTVLTGLTHVASTRYAVRLQVIGTSLKAKAWLASATEPSTWDLSVTDSSLSATGNIGVRSVLASGNTNTLPVTFGWDDLYTRGDATVERSTNQITWATVRGGLIDGTNASAYTVDDYEFAADVLNYYRVRINSFSDTDSTTPTLGGVWLKFIARPFLNTLVDPWGEINVTRRSRGGVFTVVGRSNPLAVTDVRGSRECELRVKTLTAQAHTRLDLVLAGGDPVFVHTPAGSPLPTMYAVVGDVSDDQPVPDTHLFTLPLTEVAAPAADIVGATATYQNVLNTYASYSALLAGEPTYQDVVERIGDPSDVVVP